jgi:hypothetical protein
VFEGLSAREEAFLASLEGRTADVSSNERQEFAHVIESLSDHCLLDEGVPSALLSHALVRIRAVDRITSTIAFSLAREGVGAFSIVDPRPAFPSGPFGPNAAGLTRASALAKALREASSDFRIANPVEPASLEILRGHGAIDLVLPREFVARDTSYLGIVTDEKGIDIGPLVVPGKTACETCVGMSRTERDPWWPRLALQLGGAGRYAGMHLPESAVLFAAGIAVREVIAVLSGRHPTSYQWRVPIGGETIEVKPIWPHPDCHCGANGPVGDVETAATVMLTNSSRKSR